MKSKLALYSALAFLVLMAGCQADNTKRLTLADDATYGVATEIKVAYNDQIITKDDVKAVRPFLDTARDTSNTAKGDIAVGKPTAALSVDAVITAVTTLEAQDVIKVARAHAITQPEKP